MTDTEPTLSGPALLERAELALALPLPRALGLRLVDPARPEAGVALTADEPGGLADNGAGGLHAGALGVLLEVAGYLALVPSLTASEHAVTHASATTLVAAVGPGTTVTARGVLDRRARRVAHLGVTARAGDLVVARGQLVKSVVPFPR